jgi:hypothetical protein
MCACGASFIPNSFFQILIIDGQFIMGVVENVAHIGSAGLVVSCSLAIPVFQEEPAWQ